MAEAGNVHIAFTASTQNVREEMDRGKAKAREFTREFGRATKAVGSAAPKMAKQIKQPTKAIGQFSEQVRGAPAAIAGMSASLQAMGARGTPAVQALGGAVSALFASGFTPLGIAIGLATTALGLFLAQGEKTEKVAKKAEDRMESLRDRVHRLNLELQAAEKGVPVGDIAKGRTLAEAQDLLAQRRRAFGSLDTQVQDARLRAGEARQFAAEGRLRKERGERLAGTQSIEAAHAELAAIQKTLVPLEKQRSAARARLDDQIAYVEGLKDEIEIEKRARDAAASRRDAEAAARARIAAEDGARTVGARGPGGRPRRTGSGFRAPTGPLFPDFVPISGPGASPATTMDELLADSPSFGPPRVQGTKSLIGDDVVEKVKEINREISDTERFALDAGAAVGGGFGSAFSDAVMGAESFGASIRALGRDLADMLLQFGIKAGLGVGLNALFPGTGIVSALGLPGIPGLSAPKGATLAQSPSKAASAGGLTVNVINNAGVQVKTQQRADGGIDMVLAAVARDINEGGPTHRALSSTYGIQRRGGPV